MLFEDFQDGHHGCHLGHQNGKSLVVLNFHVTPMPPTKFQLKLTIVWEQMWSEGFQDGHNGSHLGYQNGTILAILNLNVTPLSLGSIRLGVQEQIWFEDFQDGHYGLGY